MAENMSCHSSAHIHVTRLSIPGEEMTDLWNKCIVGSFKNWDILQTVDKTN